MGRCCLIRSWNRSRRHPSRRCCLISLDPAQMAAVGPGVRCGCCFLLAACCCLLLTRCLVAREGGNHLADGNNLAVGLLDTAQAFHEVPKAAARDDLVLSEQVHAVHLALRIVLRVLVVRDVPSDDLVLRLARGQIGRLLPHCESNCRGHRGGGQGQQAHDWHKALAPKVERRPPRQRGRFDRAEPGERRDGAAAERTCRAAGQACCDAGAGGAARALAQSYAEQSHTQRHGDEGIEAQAVRSGDEGVEGGQGRGRAAPQSHSPEVAAPPPSRTAFRRRR